MVCLARVNYECGFLFMPQFTSEYFFPVSIMLHTEIAVYSIIFMLLAGVLPALCLVARQCIVRVRKSGIAKCLVWHSRPHTLYQMAIQLINSNVGIM